MTDIEKPKPLTPVERRLAVYPEARVQAVAGGLLLKPSPPPVSATRISVPALPAVEKPGDE
jgi:hypothetical protein